MESLHEKLDSTSYNTQTRFLVNFIGCKGNPHMLEFVKYLEVSISNDYTSESNFVDKYNKYLSNIVNEGNMSLIDGKMIGIKDSKNQLVTIDRLFDTTYLEFVDGFYGIYIPDDMISKELIIIGFLKLVRKIC